MQWLENKNINYQLIFQLMIVFYIFGSKFTNLFFGLLILYWLTDGNIRTKLRVAFSDSRTLLFSSFFLLYLLGLLYSSNLSFAGRIMENKIPLVLFPAILSSIRLDQRTFQNILYTFVITTLIVALMGLGNSLYLFLQSGNPGFLYSDNLLLLTGGQAAYFSIYVNFSIVILVYLLAKQYDFKVPPYLVYLVIFFFYIMNFILASRISIIVLDVLTLGYVAYYIKKEQKWKQGVIAAFLIVAMMVGIILIFPQTLNRFRSITNLEFNYDNPNPVNRFDMPVSDENWNGLTLRLAIWSCAFEVIENNWLIGVGSGDYKDELFKVYEKRNFVYAYERQYGVHNQYIQTFINFGLIGLLVFLSMIFYPAWIAYKERNYLFLVFLFMIVIAMSTENLLNRYIGTVYYGLFNSLLAFQPGED